MVTVLMMSGTITNPGLLKIRVFSNNGYDVIISVYDVTNKILSSDLNYIIDVVMWPKFGNCSISMRKVIRIWPEKSLFLRAGLGSSSIIWDWHWVKTWNFAIV